MWKLQVTTVLNPSSSWLECCFQDITLNLFNSMSASLGFIQHIQPRRKDRLHGQSLVAITELHTSCSKNMYYWPNCCFINYKSGQSTVAAVSTVDINFSCAGVQLDLWIAMTLTGPSEQMPNGMMDKSHIWNLMTDKLWRHQVHSLEYPAYLKDWTWYLPKHTSSFQASEEVLLQQLRRLGSYGSVQTVKGRLLPLDSHTSWEVLTTKLSWIKVSSNPTVRGEWRPEFTISFIHLCKLLCAHLLHIQHEWQQHLNPRLQLLPSVQKSPCFILSNNTPEGIPPHTMPQLWLNCELIWSQTPAPKSSFITKWTTRHRQAGRLNKCMFYQFKSIQSQQK